MRLSLSELPSFFSLLHNLDIKRQLMDGSNARSLSLSLSRLPLFDINCLCVFVQYFLVCFFFLLRAEQRGRETRDVRRDRRVLPAVGGAWTAGRNSSPSRVDFEEEKTAALELSHTIRLV